MNLSMDTMDKGEKYFAFAFMLMCFLSLLFYFCVYVPQENLLQQKKQIAFDKRAELINLRGFAARNKDIDIYVKDMEDRFHENQYLLPSKMNVSPFLNDIELYASESHVEVVGMEPGPIANGEGYSYQNIALNIKCGYFELMNFMEMMEREGRFINIKYIKASVDDTHRALDVKINLTIYSYKG